jgi:hypothetical protein
MTKEQSIDTNDARKGLMRAHGALFQAGFGRALAASRA